LNVGNNYLIPNNIMKSIKYIGLLISIMLLTECEKAEEYEFKFGDVQTGFQIDSIYKTGSSGFLYVQFKAANSSSFLRILADQNPEPSTEIARIPWVGAVTLPLKKDIFWVVESHISLASNPPNIRDTLITWTPIE
jgi:hypothetical protein